MFKKIAEITSAAQTSKSSGVTTAICKWPKLRYGEASLQLTLPRAGDYIEYTFTDNPNLQSEYGPDDFYTIFRLLCCFYGGTFPDKHSRPGDFTFAVALFNGSDKLIEWFIPAANSTLTSHDFDTQPLIGAGKFEFTKFRVRALKDNTAIFYLAGAFLLDEDFESSLKDALELQLDRSLDYSIGQTVVAHNAGDEELQISPDASVRAGQSIRIGTEEHAIDSFKKTETATILTLDNTGSGYKLAGKYPPGTPVTGFVIATARDVADSDDMYPRFTISGSEIPPRDPMLAASNQVFPRSSYVCDPAGKHTVGEQYPDKAYKYPVQIHIYAPDLDLSQRMKLLLRKLFSEDSFMEIAGNHIDYTFNGIDPQVEWDSFQSIPHAIMHLVFDIDENLSLFQYRAFPTVKRIDLTISPYKLLTGA